MSRKGKTSVSRCHEEGQDGLRVGQSDKPCSESGSISLAAKCTQRCPFRMAKTQYPDTGHTDTMPKRHRHRHGARETQTHPTQPDKHRENQQGHLQLEDTGREMQVPPERTVVSLRSEF